MTPIVPLAGSFPVDIQRLVNEGRLYISTYIVTGQSASFNYHIRTSAAKRTFISAFVASSLGMTAALIEAPSSISAAGTAMPIYACSRVYADNALDFKLYSASTYSGGTMIAQLQSGFGSSPGQASSGDIAYPFFWELKPSTDYIYLNTPSASLTATGRLLIYEQDMTQTY